MRSPAVSLKHDHDFPSEWYFHLQYFFVFNFPRPLLYGPFWFVLVLKPSLAKNKNTSKFLKIVPKRNSQLSVLYVHVFCSSRSHTMCLSDTITLLPVKCFSLYGDSQISLKFLKHFYEGRGDKFKFYVYIRTPWSRLNCLPRIHHISMICSKRNDLAMFYEQMSAQIWLPSHPWNLGCATPLYLLLDTIF